MAATGGTAPSAAPQGHAGDHSYVFPTGRLRTQQDSSKTPLVLVVCGSFR